MLHILAVSIPKHNSRLVWRPNDQKLKFFLFNGILHIVFKWNYLKKLWLKNWGTTQGKEKLQDLQANTIQNLHLNERENNKHSFKISCTNIHGLNRSNKLESKNAHILNHLESDINIITDAHTME